MRQIARKYRFLPIDAARRGFSLLELLVVIAIIGVLTALVLPAVQKVRVAVQRTECLNHLRQMGLAAHQYHQAHHAFPPGCSYKNGADPNPHMSWMTRLLPYLEMEELWRQSLRAFEKDKFFMLPSHWPILGKKMPAFLCPADDHSHTAMTHVRYQVALTDYLGVEGTDLRARDGVLFLDSRVALTDIGDGTSHTLLVGERPPNLTRNLGWWYAGWGQEKTGSADTTLGVREIVTHRVYVQLCPPGPYHFLREAQRDRCDAFHFWSFHPGGANFLFADGSARFLAYEVDRVMPALATRMKSDLIDMEISS